MNLDKYELAIIDADTPILRAALSVQTNYVVVTNKESGKSVRFKNQTEWWGHWKNKSGGKLKEYNSIRSVKGLPIWTPDDFTLEECSELNTEIDDHLEKAIEQFDFFVGMIKRFGFAKDYLLGIAGSGNFRYECAQQLPYKGLRKDKPLLFKEVKEAIIQKYSRKCVVVDDMEVDDWCAIKGFENYQHFKKTGEWKYVIGYLDKDLKQIISPQFNYGDDKPSVMIPTAFDAAHAFCVQLLAGDKGTDNIPGLPNLSQEIRDKYNMGKIKGIGAATAIKFLEGCEDINSLFNRVVEAYRGFYGDGVSTLISHRGETLHWKWIDYLQDNAKLLWLCRTPDEEYDIRQTLKRLGISYEQ